MFYDARITIHQRPGKKPNYVAVHEAMARLGFRQKLLADYAVLETLGGMYRMSHPTQPLETTMALIRGALGPLGFRFSIELIEGQRELTENLESAAAEMFRPAPLAAIPSFTSVAANIKPHRNTLVDWEKTSRG